MGKATEVALPVPVVEEQQEADVDTSASIPGTLISLDQLRLLDEAESAAERVTRLQTALGVQHYPANPRTTVWVDYCFGVLSFARDDAQLPPDKVLRLLTLAHELYVFATQPLEVESPPPPAQPVERTQDTALETGDAVQAPFEVPKSPSVTPVAEYPSVEATYDQFRDKIRAASGVLNAATAPVTESQTPADDMSSTPAAPGPSTVASEPFSVAEVTQIVAFFTSTFFRHLRAYQFLSRVARESVVRESVVAVETPMPPPPLSAATLQKQ